MAVWISFAMIGSAAAQEEGEPDSAIVQKVEQLGGKVMKIAQNDEGLEVYFHLGRNHEGLRQFETPKPGAPKPPALDGELGVLKEVENLVWLHLGGTDATDQGLPHLAGLTSLTRLHLERTKVSDAGLAHLKDLQNLAYLKPLSDRHHRRRAGQSGGFEGAQESLLVADQGNGSRSRETAAGSTRLQDRRWLEGIGRAGGRGNGREEGRGVLVRLLKAAKTFAVQLGPPCLRRGFSFWGAFGCRLG